MNSVSALNAHGFCLVDNVFTDNEVFCIIEELNNYSVNSDSYKSENLFSIRNLLLNVPALKSVLLNNKLKQLVSDFGENFKVVKSIYFDKPPLSNWFVPNHQDLTINVKEKITTPNFENWVEKGSYFSVQPPVKIL